MKTKHMKHLGKQDNTPTKTLDCIPWKGVSGAVVTLDCSEFTSHCPVTKQPDFGRLVIEYEPAASLVETKSLKLYLWSFRSQPQFNEVLVNDIASDFFTQVRPRWVMVTGRFHPRGGISVIARASIGRQSLVDEAQVGHGEWCL